MNKLWPALLGASFYLMCSFVQAQEDFEALNARGEAFYFEQVSCWICHGDDASGRVGPTLLNGPTPLEIQEQLDSNPQMTIIVSELDPTIDDLVAVSVYLGGLAGETFDSDTIAQWRTEVAALRESRNFEVDYPVTARDQQIMNIQSFDTVIADWGRKARTGSLRRDYEVQVLAEYEPAEQVFFPEPNSLYFYENTGTGGSHAPDPSRRTSSTGVVVGDSATKEVIASSEMPAELRGAVHTTAVSPDGRWVYLIGPSGARPAGQGGSILRTPATLLKVDALTLQPVKQLNIGGRLHHAQIFQDRYILMDTFISDPDGLDVFLFDPETDSIVGGVSTRDLGGSNYTAFTDNEYIYVLMQPGNDGGSLTQVALHSSGEYTALRPYWVAKIDPETWEVVAEFPYRGFRANWITIDSNSEYMYVPASSSNLTKLSMEDGSIPWSRATGIGPYGSALNADETELWVANKGEATGHIGRTITVMNADNGQPLETLFSGYAVDHVLLDPTGTEMWATSNGDGIIYVFDAETKEQTHAIEMPGFGQPHGLVWVYYDENGEARVVRDQGNFHGGIHPAKGMPLELD